MEKEKKVSFAEISAAKEVEAKLLYLQNADRNAVNKILKAKSSKYFLFIMAAVNDVTS